MTGAPTPTQGVHPTRNGGRTARGGNGSIELRRIGAVGAAGARVPAFPPLIATAAGAVALQAAPAAHFGRAA